MAHYMILPPTDSVDVLASRVCVNPKSCGQHVSFDPRGPVISIIVPLRRFSANSIREKNCGRSQPNVMCSSMVHQARSRLKRRRLSPRGRCLEKIQLPPSSNPRNIRTQNVSSWMHSIRATSLCQPQDLCWFNCTAPACHQKR